MTDIGPVEAMGWQSLPRRARNLSMLLRSLFALPIGAAVVVLAALFDTQASWWLAGTVAVVLAAFGAWRGQRRWKYTRWRLDDAGFVLRRGHWWHSETQVPQSRVQHLDLLRGPLQRRYGLATLVIHTAGTRNNAVMVAGLDGDDAERLRDVLARQVDDDDVDA